MTSVKLKINEQAALWYEEELKESKPKYVRLFPRYGGVGGIVPGFSIGINFDEPENIMTSYEIKGMVFFIEQSDAWYFEGKKQLFIEWDEEKNEPKFNYS